MRNIISFRIFIVFIFLAVFALCIPLSLDYGAWGVPNSIHTTMGVFALETGMTDFMDDCNKAVKGCDESLNKAIDIPLVLKVTVWLLFLVAPILTGAFFLSFFRNVSSRFMILMSRYRDIYYFSELNRNTMNLARSIIYGQKDQKRKRRIVFYGVDRDEMEDSSFIKDAEEIEAVLVPYDISRQKEWKLSNRRSSYWICASDDEQKNIESALKLEKHMYVKDSKKEHDEDIESVIYVFASNVESAMLFACVSTDDEKKKDSGKEGESDDGNAKPEDGKDKPVKDSGNRKAVKGKDFRVMRKEPARSLIWNYMYDKASDFIYAADGLGAHRGCNYVNAVIVGLTRESLEMFHMLPWLIQFPGWRLNLHVFDSDEFVESRLRAECPELLTPRYNNDLFDSRYHITIHSDTKYDTYEFQEELWRIDSDDKTGHISFVFVSCGNDDDNIRIAAGIRNLLGYGTDSFKHDIPHIASVLKDIDDPEDLGVLDKAKEYKGLAGWHIDFLSCSDAWNECLLKGSEIEEIGILVNRIYNGAPTDCAKESDSSFWMYEYCYRSSCSIAMGLRLYRMLHLPILSKEELARYEHLRWITYMRSMGWKYADSSSCIKGHGKIKGWNKMKDEDRYEDISKYSRISRFYYDTPMNRAVYAFLWNHGRKLFDKASVSPSGEKVIRALIIGYSHYSVEMLKALIWYCQIDGYFLDLTFRHEAGDKAEESFSRMCPEIMDCHNGNTDINESRYRVRFTSAALSKMDDGGMSFVFASENWNGSGTPDLELLKSKYSDAMILVDMDPIEGSGVYTLRDANIADDAIEMEKAGLARHLLWSDESSSFWNSSYNYSSSISSAMHIRLRCELGLPGADVAPKERSAEQKAYIERMEHARWNAWMRSEGWCFASVRDNAQKKHHLLIPFDQLDKKEKDKDNV